MNYLFVAAAFLCGAVVPLQAAVNAVLRTHLPSAMQSALISFAVGTIALLLYCIADRAPWPTASSLAQVPWWGWTGGIVGVYFVFSSLVVVPKLGAAVTLGIIVAGQMIASLLMDHYGMLGLTQQPITLWRAFGVLLVIAGVGVTMASSK